MKIGCAAGIHTGNSYPCWLRGDIKTRDLEERTQLIQHLKGHEIGAVFHYIPLHSSEAGKRFGRFHGEDRYTTKESERLLRLPMYYGLDSDDIEKITDCVKQFYK